MAVYSVISLPKTPSTHNIHTVLANPIYDRIFSDFPAKNAVYTQYTYGSGQLYSWKVSRQSQEAFLILLASGIGVGQNSMILFRVNSPVNPAASSTYLWAWFRTPVSHVNIIAIILRAHTLFTCTLQVTATPHACMATQHCISHCGQYKWVMVNVLRPPGAAASPALSAAAIRQDHQSISIPRLQSPLGLLPLCISNA